MGNFVPQGGSGLVTWFSTCGGNTNSWKISSPLNPNYTTGWNVTPQGGNPFTAIVTAPSNATTNLAYTIVIGNACGTTFSVSAAPTAPAGPGPSSPTCG